MAEAITHRDPLVRVTLVEEEGPQPLPLAGHDSVTMPLSLSSTLGRDLHPALPQHWRHREGQERQEAEAQLVL